VHAAFDAKLAAFKELHSGLGLPLPQALLLRADRVIE